MTTRFAIFVVTAISLAAFAPTGPDISPGSAAYADGGQDPASKPKKKPGAKKKKKKKPSAKKEAPAVPATDQSSVRSVRVIQDKLHRYAKKDNLTGLSTDVKRLRNLQRDIDRQFVKYGDTSDRNEPNQIFLQLSKYQGYKPNPTLSKNARIVSTGIATVRLLDRALAIKKKCAELKKAGKDIERINCEEDYKEARSDYHRKAKKIKDRKAREKLFQPLPKSPYD